MAVKIKVGTVYSEGPCHGCRKNQQTSEQAITMLRDGKRIFTLCTDCLARLVKVGKELNSSTCK